MKIYSLYQPTSADIFNTIYNTLFELLPDGMTETFDYKEADAFFCCSIENAIFGGVTLSTENDEYLFQPLNWSYIEDFQEVVDSLINTPRIIYMDKFALSIGYEEYPLFVRDIDIPAAATPMPSPAGGSPPSAW